MEPEVAMLFGFGIQINEYVLNIGCASDYNCEFIILFENDKSRLPELGGECLVKN